MVHSFHFILHTIFFIALSYNPSLACLLSEMLYPFCLAIIKYLTKVQKVPPVKESLYCLLQKRFWEDSYNNFLPISAHIELYTLRLQCNVKATQNKN